jgi:hypothetical protein
MSTTACLICGRQVPTTMLEFHVNRCLDGDEDLDVDNVSRPSPDDDPPPMIPRDIPPIATSERRAFSHRPPIPTSLFSLNSLSRPHRQGRSHARVSSSPSSLSSADLQPRLNTGLLYVRIRGVDVEGLKTLDSVSTRVVYQGERRTNPVQPLTKHACFCHVLRVVDFCGPASVGVHINQHHNHIFPFGTQTAVSTCTTCDF